MTDRKSLEPNRAIADHIPVVASGTTGALVPQDAGQAMEFAKLMALGGVGIPAHLRGNPGTCLRIVSDAMTYGMSPFHLADDSYEINGRLSYGAKSIYAMTLRSGVIDGDLPMEFKGEGESLECTVTGRRKGGAVQPKTVRLSQVKTRNSPLWKTDTHQQLGYYTRRAWCRLHAPDAIMGLLAAEDPPIDAGEAQIVDVPQTDVDRVAAQLNGPEPEPEPQDELTPAERKALEISEGIAKCISVANLTAYWKDQWEHIKALPAPLAERLEKLRFEQNQTLHANAKTKAEQGELMP